MSYYDIPRNFLYKLYHNYPHEFENMIMRFFKRTGKIVMDEVKKIITDGYSGDIETFHEMFKRYGIHPGTEYNNTQSVLDMKLMKQHKIQEDIKALNINIDEIQRQCKSKNISLIYLDFGCNDGTLTVAIAKLFNIPAKNVYCCDIVDQSDIIKKAGFNYVKVHEKNPTDFIESLPDKIHLISFFNVLHHIPTIISTDMLVALESKVPLGANVIIKEHDCRYRYDERKDRMLIAEWHKLYQIVYDETDFMGDMNFMSIIEIKALFIHLNCITTHYMEPEKDDIMKSYMCLLKKIL